MCAVRARMHARARERMARARTHMITSMPASLLQVGGMMVFIVCHELLPAAHRYMGDGNKTTAWFILGMVIMAISLVAFLV